MQKNQPGGPGFTLFQSQCALCHGADRKGSPPQFPPLLGVSDRLSDAAITADHPQRARPHGRIPKYPGRQPEGVARPISTLARDRNPQASDRTSDKVEAVSLAKASGEPLKYHFTGYKKFLDPDGYPAIAPPWGTLNAIDLNTGKYLWKVPFGQYPELAAKGMTETGSENYGGPVVTASGLVIIAATNYDRKIRGFNSDTGELLWEADLPYAGNATPATYMVDGKQYVVIATSGARDRKHPQGAAYVAFTLP